MNGDGPLKNRMMKLDRFIKTPFSSNSFLLNGDTDISFLQFSKMVLSHCYQLKVRFEGQGEQNFLLENEDPPYFFSLLLAALLCNHRVSLLSKEGERSFRCSHLLDILERILLVKEIPNPHTNIQTNVIEVGPEFFHDHEPLTLHRTNSYICTMDLKKRETIQIFLQSFFEGRQISFMPTASQEYRQIIANKMNNPVVYLDNLC